MNYKVETGVQPDGIRITLLKPFWVDTYEEAWVLIETLDKLERNPKIFVREEQS